MYKLFLGLFVVLLISVGVYAAYVPRTISIDGEHTSAVSEAARASSTNTVPPIEIALPPEAPPQTTSSAISPTVKGDIGFQPQLPNPPEVVKGLYLTGWTAGSASRVSALIGKIAARGMNAAVVDIKDYSGFVSYAVPDALVSASGAEHNLRIAHPNRMIKMFHDRGVYLIGRITIFQDPVLAASHPEWAVKNKATGRVWTDRKGLSWMDPAARPVWDYNLAIARDALSRGFDEVNIDYVRFPSDGNLSLLEFPYWSGKESKNKTVRDFFSYFTKNLPAGRASVDLFGLTTVQNDDLGIGQIIEDAYPYFSAVSPMTYPSHYASGFLGYKNPALYPYEVISYSMEKALARLEKLKLPSARVQVASSSSSSSTSSLPNQNSNQQPMARLRPWLQVFDLGAIYTHALVEHEIQAVENVLGSRPEVYGGWLLWDPKNLYDSV